MCSREKTRGGTGFWCENGKKKGRAILPSNINAKPSGIKGEKGGNKPIFEKKGAGGRATKARDKKRGGKRIEVTNNNPT